MRKRYPTIAPLPCPVRGRGGGGGGGEMCQAIFRYAKANNKYMNKYDKNKESSYLEYLDANHLYGWAICKKLPVGNFKWLDNEDRSKFNDELIKKI